MCRIAEVDYRQKNASETSRGKTVAVVSHDTEFLSKACDQIVLIE